LHAGVRRYALTLGVPAAVAALAPPLAAWRRHSWAATPAERLRPLPGDELIPGAPPATTIDAPPDVVWPWLAQMGCDRGGFYSWDRLDNGGRPSAKEIHDGWQDVVAGSRIASRPDGSAWFTVARCDAPYTLVLRASLDLRGRPFDPAGSRPRRFTDGVWGFHLTPLERGRTRLVVRSASHGEPRRLTGIANAVFWKPAHWVMQTKQFHELRHRATGSTRREGRAPARSPATAGR
jgi:proline iminopeptidase